MDKYLSKCSLFQKIKDSKKKNCQRMYTTLLYWQRYLYQDMSTNNLTEPQFIEDKQKDMESVILHWKNKPVFLIECFFK